MKLPELLKKCSYCKGSGHKDNSHCSDCKGYGIIPTEAGKQVYEALVEAILENGIDWFLEKQERE